MQYREHLSQAIRNVRANMLRAVLTLLIIAFGIMALVGILTSIDALLFTMNDNFSRMGANSFDIRAGNSSNVHSNRRGREEKQADPIVFRQAIEFKDRYNYPSSLVSVSGLGKWNAIIKYGKEKTNPSVLIFGIDDNYLTVHGYDLQLGRNFTPVEQEAATQVAIIGMDIVNSLFNRKPEAALNKDIIVDNQRFVVVGVLTSKGASMNQSADRRILIPLFSERRLYGYPDKNYTISVSTHSPTDLEEATSMAIGIMRNVRQLKASEDNDFETFQSDSLLNMLKENTATIRIATVGIGLITLIGAAIGLMNIMLVSVTERTREIGISKAIGATRANILSQFLTEAVLICQMGGIVGIVLGIAIGNGVAMILGGKFIMPWAWIILGLVMCMAVGLVSGLYPALKAARLDPIESLRYE
ncbi:MAG TPA: ABC transporter permease [Saprospiraceae bacterium]|nr:ABC transporter permease [Saprospiraceae bacterium]